MQTRQLARKYVEDAPGSNLEVSFKGSRRFQGAEGGSRRNLNLAAAEVETAAPVILLGGVAAFEQAECSNGVTKK